MARNGSGVYSAPSGTTATSQTVIESAKYNAFVADLVADANLARPVVAGGTGSTTPLAARTALRADYAAINFFDFLDALTDGQRAQIRAGTYMSDLATEWTAFHAALQAVATSGGRPYGFIPECTIYTSVSPNFGIMFLRLETQGNVRVINTGGLSGMLFDGAPSVMGVPTGLGPGGYGLQGLDIDPIEASTTTGDIGYDVIWCHKSTFRRPTSNGGLVAGVAMRGCVSTDYDQPQASDRHTLTWLSSAPPFATIWVTSYEAYVSDLAASIDAPASWCNLIAPVGEYATDACVLLENCYGINIYGGASQGGGYGAASGLGAGRGLVLGAECRWAKVYGHDSEYNVSDDVWLKGSENTFWGTDSQTTFRIEGADAFGNQIYGGKHSSILLDASTTYNLIQAPAETITDLGAQNRVVNAQKKSGDTSIIGWHDEWTTYTPTLTAASGTLGTSSSTGRYYKVGKLVHFWAQGTITTNWTGSGAVVMGLPFVSARDLDLTGAERAITAQIVFADVTASTANMVLKFDGGAYPGGDGHIIRVSGTYEAA